MTHDNEQLVAELPTDTIDGPRRQLTRGTFKVAVANKLQRRVGRTADVIARGVRRCG
jgi:hypothetical protein